MDGLLLKSIFMIILMGMTRDSILKGEGTHNNFNTTM